MRRLIPALVILAAAAAVVLALYSTPGGERRGSQSIDLRDVSTAERSVAGPHGGASKENVTTDFRAELASLRSHLAQTPEDTTLLLRTARLLHDAHQPGEAVVFYERYTAIDTGNREVWLDLANVYAALRRWEEALRASQSVLKIIPNDAAAMYNIGAIYANMGRTEDARRWWERVRDHPDDSLAGLARESLDRLPTTAR